MFLFSKIRVFYNNLLFKILENKFFKLVLGVYFVLAIPNAFVTFIELLGDLLSQISVFYAFFVGIATYWLIERFIGKSQKNYHFFSTLFHELTHLLFGVLCGLVPGRTGVHLKPKDGRMGYQEWNEGKLNWLVSLCPYFFPLPTFILIIIFTIAYNDISINTQNFLLGCSISYYLIANIKQVHPDQSDFRSAGPFFSGGILITANFISIGGALSYVYAGNSKMINYIVDCLSIDGFLF